MKTLVTRSVCKMTEVFYRYRLVFIILSLIILITAVWLVVARQSSSKIPSRGVFVYGTFDVLRGG